MTGGEAAKRIVIRADASHEMGTGHVMRCLTLARTLRQRGAEVHFVCREHDGNLNGFLEAAGFAVYRLALEETGRVADPQALAPPHAHWLGASWERDADQTLRAMGERAADWLIVDHYGLDSRWQEQLRTKAHKILVIDDLADRQNDCDVLLDQNFFSNASQRYQDRVPQHATLLLGPTYALLGPDYACLRRRAMPRSGVPNRVLVSFGGADQLGLTRRTVEALLSLPFDIEADIILSQGSGDHLPIKQLLVEQSSIRLHDRVATLAPFMLAADLAIGAGGATNWERMCLGLPTLVVTMADNQREIAKHLASQGLIRWLGEADTVGVDEIRSAIEAVAGEGLDPEWSSRCMNIADGRGVERVAAVIEAGPDMALVVRHGDLGDEDLLLEWANDPVTRANGYNPRPISREDHVRWYRTRLRNPMGCKLFIVETATGVPVGQVRFDNRDGEWEISYTVAPAFRARGVGRVMLEATLRELDQDSGAIIGRVKPDNVPSRRIFEALGFSLRSSDPDRLVFERLKQN